MLEKNSDFPIPEGEIPLHFREPGNVLAETWRGLAIQNRVLPELIKVKVRLAECGSKQHRNQELRQELQELIKENSGVEQRPGQITLDGLLTVIFNTVKHYRNDFHKNPDGFRKGDKARAEKLLENLIKPQTVEAVLGILANLFGERLQWVGKLKLTAQSFDVYMINALIEAGVLQQLLPDLNTEEDSAAIREILSRDFAQYVFLNDIDIGFPKVGVGAISDLQYQDIQLPDNFETFNPDEGDGNLGKQAVFIQRKMHQFYLGIMKELDPNFKPIVDLEKSYVLANQLEALQVPLDSMLNLEQQNIQLEEAIAEQQQIKRDRIGDVLREPMPVLDSSCVGIALAFRQAMVNFSAKKNIASEVEIVPRGSLSFDNESDRMNKLIKKLVCSNSMKETLYFIYRHMHKDSLNGYTIRIDSKALDTYILLELNQRGLLRYIIQPDDPDPILLHTVEQRKAMKQKLWAACDANNPHAYALERLTVDMPEDGINDPVIHGFKMW